MAHRYRLGETVVPTVYVREFNAVYEVVRLLPEDVTGDPQYRLRNTESGIELVSREAEMKPYRAQAMPAGRF